MTKTKESEGAARGSALHTTGPWVIRRGVCRNDHPDTSPDVYGPDGQFVANCGCHEQANANAALIAVAPNMLAMLRRLEWLPDAGGNLCCPECFGHTLHNPGCALRTLLASAASARSAPK